MMEKRKETQTKPSKTVNKKTNEKLTVTVMETRGSSRRSIATKANNLKESERNQVFKAKQDKAKSSDDNQIRDLDLQTIS